MRTVKNAPCVICQAPAGVQCDVGPGLQRAARMIPENLVLLLMYDLPSLARAITTVGCLLFVLTGCKPVVASQPPTPPTITGGTFK